MVEEADALARILAAAEPLDAVELPLREVVGLFLAKPIRSTLAHPRFDNSVVDGYALRVEDGMVDRKIIGEQPAGLDRALKLENGEAIRIFTGAPIPQGCTGVIMQEDVETKEDRLILRDSLELHENIRRMGADLAVGQLIGRAGQQITPQLVGLLASQGMATVSVHRLPKVTILSTGDELRPAGANLKNGEIYDSNGLMLAALLKPLGITAQLRHCLDNPQLIQAEMQAALANSDVLIVSGGVSVGNHDHVKPVLSALGISLDFWQIRMKPGKPLAFAHASGKLIFGLPGNPVASFVTFLVLLRPALLQMLGAENDERFLAQRTAFLDSPISNPGNRPHYVRGVLQDGRFISKGLQESHALYGLSRSNAFLRMEAGEQLPAGEERKIIVWS